MGIEPTRPAWKAGILAIELHPHIGNGNYNTTNQAISQGIFQKNFLDMRNIEKESNCFFSPGLDERKIMSILSLSAEKLLNLEE